MKELTVSYGPPFNQKSYIVQLSNVAPTAPLDAQLARRALQIVGADTGTVHDHSTQTTAKVRKRTVVFKDHPDWDVPF